MENSRHAAVRFELQWRSADAVHSEHYHMSNLNLWRDFLPGDLADMLGRAAVGDTVEQSFRPGELVEPYGRHNVFPARRNQFRDNYRGTFNLRPRLGRFFPRALIPGVGDTFEDDIRPFRVIALDEQQFQADCNHPLASYELTVRATLLEQLPGGAEHGGRCNDIPDMLCGRGPGMQASLPGIATDLLDETAFERMDARDDREFYTNPRMVQHLDAAARGEISALYGRLLQPGMRVLDLMTSWDSHLPALEGLHVTGLGLNSAEMEHNARLDERVVHDINAAATLPFGDGQFDGAVCTASVEYLIEPFAVFTELARVLKPGAPLVVTFSDRWFPTKSIRAWEELHPFERVALVLEYFRRDERFTDLQTLSVRNLPRPADDKYYGQLRSADPVFAVWGRRSD